MLFSRFSLSIWRGRQLVTEGEVKKNTGKILRKASRSKVNTVRKIYTDPG
jgi:hypothetical protein